MSRSEDRHGKVRRRSPTAAGDRAAAWAPAAVAAALAAVTFLVYAGALRHPFLFYDDDLYIAGNPAVRAGLTWRGVVWAFTTFRATNWHPLTWLSHMLDVQLFGLRPAGHHLSSLLLHCANAALLFAAVRRMTGALWRSAIVAALFALHPLHVESVAWVAERKDVLSTFFGLLALLAYAGYARRPRAESLAAVTALFACSLLAKPMLVTLPFLLLLLDRWPLARALGPAALLREKFPLLLLALASATVTWIAQSTGGAVSSAEAYPLAGRVANAALAYTAYLGKALWPAGLAIFYPHPGDNIPWARAATAGAGLAAVTLLAVRRRTGSPSFFTGWFWYLGTLVPVIGLVQVGGQAMADRYTYVPLVGIFLAGTWGIGAATMRRPLPRWTLALAAAALLGGLALASRHQLGYWRDASVLFAHAARAVPENWFAEAGLGVQFARQGHFAEAVPHYDKAVRLRPQYAEARMNFGVTLQALGRLEEARTQLEEAARLRPDLGEIHYNLGALLQGLGRLEEAKGRYAQALRVEPGLAKALSNLGAIANGEGRGTEAVGFWRRAIAADPELAEAHFNIGITLGSAGEVKEGVKHLAEAVRLRPDDPEMRMSLATGLIAEGQSAAAAQELRHVLRLRPGDPAATAQLEAIGRR